MRLVLVLGAAALAAACSTSVPTGAGYTRIDGRPVEDGPFRAVAAQCKGEGAQSAPGWVGGGLVGMGIAMNSSANKEADIVTACMARHGFVTR